ncbi:fimbrial protein [Morganella psychrotolerans]|uniref:fimbrial protein n=1 Tax=Morganella psychrotolerans TaxID=368603 RepID=UPI0039AF4998
MKILIKYTSVLCSGLLMCSAAYSTDVEIKGQLVFEPCTLSAKSESISLSFGTIVKNYFYTADKTPSEPFSIELENCDTGIGNEAFVTFRGTESSALPGLLVPDNGSLPGFAIGVETPEGALLPLNTTSPAYALSDGATTLNFQGYIQAEPDAIKDKTLVTGDLSATATFEITYP